MRAGRSFVLVAVLALAGCAGQDDAGGQAPTATPTPGPTPTGEGNSSGAFQTVDLSHDFGGDPATATFTVPPDAPPLALHAWIAAGTQGACAYAQIAVRVTDPAGTERALVGPGRTPASVMNDVCDPGVEIAGALEEGEWIVSFEGRGVATGRIVVEAA